MGVRNPGYGFGRRIDGLLRQFPAFTVEPIPLLAQAFGGRACASPLSLRFAKLSIQALVHLVAVAVVIQLLFALLDTPNDFRKLALELGMFGYLRWNAVQQQFRGFAVAVLILEFVHAILQCVDLPC